MLELDELLELCTGLLELDELLELDALVELEELVELDELLSDSDELEEAEALSSELLEADVLDPVELDVLLDTSEDVLVSLEETVELLGVSETVVPLLHAVNVSNMDADRITLKTFFFIFYPFHFLLGTNIPTTIIYNVNRFFDFLYSFLLFSRFA